MLVRVDHNTVKNGKIKDVFRIDQTIATLYNIIERGGRPILMTHVGRPFDKASKQIMVSEAESVLPVVKYLESKLGIRVCALSSSIA